MDIPEVSLHEDTREPQEFPTVLDLFNPFNYELFVKIAIIALLLQHHFVNNHNNNFSEILRKTNTFQLSYYSIKHLLYTDINEISFSYIFLAIILLFKSDCVLFFNLEIILHTSLDDPPQKHP